LVDSYAQGDRYNYMLAFRSAARAIAGEKLAQMFEADLIALQDIGLDHLGDRAAKLRTRWAAHDHPAAKEVVAWLDGDYVVTGEILQTQ
jgi:hypothetical protein